MKYYHNRWLILLGLLLLIGVSGLFTVAQNDEQEQLRIAFVSNRRGNEDIYLMTQNGEEDPLANLTDDPARDWHPAWSPDGSRILFNSNRDGYDGLYTMNFDGSDVRPVFAGDRANDYDAVYSPDGTRIAFVSDRAGAGRELFVATLADNSIVQITDDSKLRGNPTWSADGTELVYWELDNNGEIYLFRRNLETDIVQLITAQGPANGAAVWVGDVIYFDTNREGLWYIYRMADNGDFPERISEGGVNSGRATVAPDGSRLAFVTDRDESEEIYLMNPDGTGLRRLTENGFSDHSPAWQPRVPDIAMRDPIPATPVPVDEAATEEPEEEAAAPVVGLSVNGVAALPISKDQLLIDYGISAWHEAGWTGAGQRVGVIDLAFGGLTDFKSRYGEVLLLPGDSEADYNDSSNQHGTYVMEVIRAIAPNAELYACRYDGTIDDLRDCTDWMYESGVRIINHSVGIPVLPLDGSSAYAELVNGLFARGVLWVNAAGNFADGTTDGQGYTDSDGDGYHNFSFGTSTNSQLTTRAIEDTYSGTILLSWEEPEFDLINPDTGRPERINLDLEIVDSTGQFWEGRDDQSSNIALPSAEIVRVENAVTPLRIDVRNTGIEFGELNVEFIVFAEFIPFPDNVIDPNGNVVSPADALNSLTVGSVNGLRQQADYSSFGVDNPTFTKPDVFAPGEIYMDDGTAFIGTSAAAPVVAGIVALLREENNTRTIDQIFIELQSKWTDLSRQLVYSATIVQLGAPENTRLDIGVVDTPPYVIFPREEDEFVDQGFVCPNTLPARMDIGVPGYVSYNLGLAIRNEPGGDELDRLDYGTQFTVIDGPACLSALVWWLVELETGAEGWVGEGNPYYLIAPVSLERARLPETTDTVCPNSLDPQLTIGERGIVSQNELRFFRAPNAREEYNTPLASGNILEVLGGPRCEGSNGNVLRWYVRVVESTSGNIGFEGWAAEGDTDTRLIDPID